MGVNYILGWYYGKLSWNRMWCHGINLTNRFSLGQRRNFLATASKVGFRLKTFKNGKEVKRMEIRSLAQGLPAIELEKDLSM